MKMASRGSKGSSTGAAFVVVLVALTGCEDSAAPAARLSTVEGVLERACVLASDCVPSSQQDIDACPAGMLSKLDGNDIAELERFTSLDRDNQERILGCFDAVICGRFGVRLSAMSDSDLMEPLVDCQYRP